MPEIDAATMGGNMRLGARPTLLHPPHNAPDVPSLASALYGGAASVSERHRHRYPRTHTFRLVRPLQYCSAPSTETAACPLPLRTPRLRWRGRVVRALLLMFKTHNNKKNTGTK